jgi:hypothetical protein
MKFIKVGMLLSLPILLSGCGLLLHGAACVATLTVIC